MDARTAARFISLTLACILGVFICFLSAYATEGDDLAKQIDKELRSVERKIVTAPSKAEGELEAVKNLFSQLQQEAPDHPKLPTIIQKIDKLDSKLAKRLGRDVKPVAGNSGQTGPVVKLSTKEVVKKEAGTVVKNADKLPGGVTSRLKNMDKGLEKVEVNLSKGSIDRADFEFKKVDKIWDEINDKYGDQFKEDHPEIVDMLSKKGAVETRLKEALAQAEAEEQARVQGEAAARALEQKWIDAFEPFLDYKNEKYLNFRIADLDEQQTDRQKKHFLEAKNLFAEYESVDFSAEKSMDLKNTENSIQSILKTLGDTYGKEEQEAGSEEWLGRLTPYIDYGSGKALIASATANVDQILNQQEIFEEAKKLFAEYQGVEFPLGKSYQLQQTEEELAKRLADFPEENKKSAAFLTEAAEKKMKQEESFFASKQEWRTDAKVLPYTFSEDRLADLDKLIDIAASVLSENDSTIQGLRKRQAKINDENTERRKIRAARTYMISDKFSGVEAADIKDKASSLVKKKHQNAKVLRATVISNDWKEETVQEWTDTTKTALRWRTTRSVTAQVAAKIGAEVRLFTIYIAKNRRSDGTWGELFGNLHSDKGDFMLEKNVNVDMP